MCDVWRATDATGQDVAVKVLRSECPAHTLRDEIQLTAQLDHPNIIQIYEWGDATDEEAAALGLAPHTPWVAMELAERGSFQAESIRSWAELRQFALQMLDAMMHSHARGVIHRDIKPGNVLVMDEHRHYVLSDFGIAFPKTRYRGGTYDVPLAAAGTLLYMSPEQLLGRWRDFGPYTDIFSLGVMLYEIAAGHLPFDGASRVAMALAHVEGAPPIDAFRISVPPGFAEWLATTLAYAPSDRFAFAADAAHALVMLGAPADDAAPVGILRPADELPTMPDWASAPTTQSERTPTSASMQATIHIGGARPPVPRDWRTRSGRGQSVGRSDERDELWRQLVDVVTQNVGRAIVMRGPDGVGVSHLARWLCERAREVGAADYVYVQRQHGSSAIADTLQHVLAVAGLDARARAERLQELFVGAADLDFEMLDHLLRALPLSVADLISCVEQVLVHFSARRPMIVWIDDAHKDIELIEMTARFTSMGSPVLLLLTVRDESVPETPFEHERLIALLEDPHASELRLGGLPDSDIAEIARSHDIAIELREALVSAARGNPLRAELLVETAAATGMISAGSVPELWLDRVQRRLTASEADALLAAAVLGEAINVPLWQRLCKRLGVACPPALPDLFITAGFWAIDHRGYRHRHGSLRGALISNEGLAERVRDFNRCAAGLYSAEFAPVAPIRAQHLVLAGDLEEGCSILTPAIFTLCSEGRAAQASSLTHWLGRQLEAQGCPPSDPIWLRYRLFQNAIWSQPGRNSAPTTVAGLVQDALDAGAPGVAAEALRVESFLLAQRGEHARAADVVGRALELVHNTGNDTLVAHLLRRQGWSYYHLLRFEEASRSFREASTSDDLAVRGLSLLGLAHALLRLNDHDGARRAGSESLDLAKSAASRVQQALSLNALAEIERESGEFANAERFYLEAMRLISRADPEGADAARVNLSAMMLQQGRTAEAAELARGVYERNASGYLRGLAELLLAVAAALDGEHAAWDTHAPPEQAYQGVEFAELWESAGEAWAARDDQSRADVAFERAVTSLGPPGVESTNAIRARLQQKLQAAHE